MSIRNKKTQSKEGSRKEALELLRENQAEAVGLLRQDEIRALELLKVDQEKAMQLLVKNQAEAARLLQQDQDRAAELLLGKESEQSQGGTETKKAAALLSKAQRQTAKALQQDQEGAVLLLRENEEKALTLLQHSQEQAAKLLRHGQEQAAYLLFQTQAIVDNSLDAIIGTTLEGVITSWNGGAVRMFGYSPAEVIGKSGSVLFPPEMWAKVPALLKKIAVREVVPDYDITGLRKDGTRFDMAVSISPIVTTEGKVLGASVVERDIAERKAIERATQDAKLFLDNVLNVAADPFFVQDVDSKFIIVNDALCDVLGLSRGDIIGKSFAQLWPKDQAQTFLSIDKGVLATGESNTTEELFTKRSGEILTMLTTISRYIDAKGNIFLVGVMHDITKRKVAEESLRQNQLIIDNSQDGIFSTSLAGDILSWNKGAEKATGYTAKEIVGKSAATLFLPERRGELQGFIDRVKNKESVLNYELVIARKDGTKIDVLLSISPIVTEDGKLTGAAVVSRDITEKKKAEHNIKELNEIRVKFIDIISHQLGTPLTSVNWNLEMLLNGDFGALEETQRKFLQATHVASVEITRRIHDLLSAMDIEEGRSLIKNEATELGSLCVSMMTEMAKKCELRGISFAYIPQKDEISSIQADGEKLRTAITKLVENAIMYNKDGGKVTAKLGMVGSTIRFEVSDTGIGIPLPEQQRVFTRFFRASNATTMQPDAFGLGLFIAKHYIEQHGGKVGFQSTEGSGSTFWFEIPVKVA